MKKLRLNLYVVRQANFNRLLRDLPRGSQAEIARALDKAPNLIYQWKKGLRSIGDDEASAIERFTGKEAGWLSTEDEGLSSEAYMAAMVYEHLPPDAKRAIRDHLGNSYLGRLVAEGKAPRKHGTPWDIAVDDVLSAEERE